MSDKRLFIDCTSIVMSDLNTGIQRVERNLISEIMKIAKEKKIRCKPVFLLGKASYLILDDINSVGYFYRFLVNLFNFWRFRRLVKSILPSKRFGKWIDKHWNEKKKWLFVIPAIVVIIPITFLSLSYICIKSFKKEKEWTPKSSDILIVTGGDWWDYTHVVQAIKNARSQGCLIVTLIHDIIPILYDEFAVATHTINFKRNFKSIFFNSSLIIGNSESTKKSIEQYFEDVHYRKPMIKSFRFGVNLDLIDSKYEKKVRSDLKSFFYDNKKRVCICVGTVEPKKNHCYLLECFDRIWNSETDIKLCIVGRRGWLSDQISKNIKNHPQYGRLLFWFEDLNDDELEYCYLNAYVLVFPSIVEGFGLPLIEALHYKCPVIASDIPVFREIGGDYCSYFSLNDKNSLKDIILSDSINKDISGFKWPTWRDSANEFLNAVLSLTYYDDK